MKKILKFIIILALTMGFVLATETLTSISITAILSINGIDFTSKDQALMAISKYQVILGQLLRLALIFLYLKIRNKNHSNKSLKINYRGFSADSWKMIVIGLGVAGFGNYIVSFLLAIIGHLPSIGNTLEQFNQAFQMTSKFDFLLMLVGVVILAPISEEILFRGIVFEKLKSSFYLELSIILSGLIFGIYHMNILQGINTFIMGIVLAYVYYYRKNIVDSILIHMVNNFFALTAGLNETYAVFMSILSTIAIFISIKYLKELKENIKVN